MAATTTTLDVLGGGWTLVGSDLTGRFTLQNKSRNSLTEIRVKSHNSKTVAPTDSLGSWDLSFKEALENKLISELWPGSAANTHIWVWAESAGRVGISYA